MGLRRLAEFAAGHRTSVVMVALVTTFAGVALLLDRPKGSVLEWLGIPLIVLGGAVFTWTVWPVGAVRSDATPTLANRFLRWITLDGRLVKLFPAFGVAIVLADLSYNLALSATPALQTEDTMVLLAAATLITYGFVPQRFARERDFILVFFIALNAILVAPLLLARLYYADFERSVDVYSWVALAPETSGILSILGVENAVHPVAGATAPGLTFTPQNLAVQVTVVITTACSGIYSFGIFASAFVAFVLTEYKETSMRMWVLLGLGFLTAYVANVLRMVVIILVGYYTDSAQTDLQNMLVAHSYAGWLIFLGWIALFWGLMFKFLPPERVLGTRSRIGRTRMHQSVCELCSGALSPAVAARRCTCGRYYHLTCFAREGRCPSCRRSLEGDGDALTRAA